MTGLVCVGLATFDTIAVVRERPGPDERVLAEELVSAGGGPAATAAVTAARLGTPPTFVGVVGDDPEGQRALDGLRAEGVDVAATRVEPGRATGASVVICERDTATRTIYHRSPGQLHLSDTTTQTIKAAQWVHVDHVGWPIVSNVLRDMDPARRPKVSVDHGNPVREPRPEIVDLYVPTIERLRSDHGDRPLYELLDRCDAAQVVATLGGDGAIGLDSRGAFWEVSALSVPVMSTLGAGDVFHGALVASVFRGDDLHTAMTYANGAAALSCRAADGRSAIPKHDELVQFLEGNR